MKNLNRVCHRLAMTGFGSKNTPSVSPYYRIPAPAGGARQSDRVWSVFTQPPNAARMWNMTSIEHDRRRRDDVIFQQDSFHRLLVMYVFGTASIGSMTGLMFSTVRYLEVSCFSCSHVPILSGDSPFTYRSPGLCATNGLRYVGSLKIPEDPS